MLNYETCAALKAAGYPQDHSIIMGYGMDGEMCGTEDFNSWWNWSDGIACPNSDDLLAAIRERWPFVILALHDLSTSNDSEWWRASGEYHASCKDERLTGTIMYKYAPTPAEALAALYIALAGDAP